MSYYFLFSSIFRKDSDFCNCLQKDHLFLSYTFAHLNFQDTFSWAWQSHWGFSLLWSSDFKSWLKIWILLSPGCLIIHTHKLFLQISQPPCSQAVLLQTLIFHMQDEKDSTSFDPLHMPGVKETFLSDHPGASLAATVLQSETSTAGGDKCHIIQCKTPCPREVPGYSHLTLSEDETHWALCFLSFLHWVQTATSTWTRMGPSILRRPEEENPQNAIRSHRVVILECSI